MFMALAIGSVILGLIETLKSYVEPDKPYMDASLYFVVGALCAAAFNHGW